MATLQGQTIVIIGGSSGIGYSVALAALKSLAAHVIVASSSSEKVAAAVKRLEQAAGSVPGKVTGKALDARSAEQVKKFFADVGEIDHMVFTSADSLKMGVFKELDLDTMKDFYDMRFWAPAAAAQQAQIKKGGSITLTTGSVIKKPTKGWSIVAGVGSAVDGLARGLAVDLAPVRVNAIAPGFVITELWDPLPKEAREKAFADAAESLLVKHVAGPDEIAEAYLFVMKCAYITGETIHVNGGQTLV